MANVLVTGGSGFIGSQTVKTLIASGHTPIVLDRDIKAWAVAELPLGRIINADISDDDAILNLFQTYEIGAMIHFAASHQVYDSMKDPHAFYLNNVVNSTKLMNYAAHYNVPVLFSGTASVYGNPAEPVMSFHEGYPVNPMNPYARTKMAVEWMIEDYHKAYGLKAIVLRYFNAAGADPEGKLGYVQEPKSHAVPILMNKIRTGEKFEIFGKTYPTMDGTCVRDYTHVQDLADAHVVALDYLLKNDNVFETINLGSGVGTSVQKLVEETARILGTEANYEFAPERLGDPAFLVADITKARDVLGWMPKYTLEDIIQHAWIWELNKDTITKETKS